MAQGTLHIISANTTRQMLEWCLKQASGEDAILFAGVVPDSGYARQAASVMMGVYQLSESGDDRTTELVPGVVRIDYRGWVQLCCDFEKTISW